MQYYNYADEIIKNDDTAFSGSSYVRYSTPGNDDNIVNEQSQETPVNTGEESDTIKIDNIVPDEKKDAFKEGIKDDNINIDEESTNGLTVDPLNK